MKTIGLCLLFLGLEVSAKSPIFWETFDTYQFELTHPSQQRSPASRGAKIRSKYFSLKEKTRGARILRWQTDEPFPLLLDGPLAKLSPGAVFERETLYTPAIIDIGRIWHQDHLVLTP